jgi:hypothetical protein
MLSVPPNTLPKSGSFSDGRTALTLFVDGSWSGWDGETIVQLTDGSVWRQDEYYYEYHHAYRPEVNISDGEMTVNGMQRAIRVRRVS